MGGSTTTTTTTTEFGSLDGRIAPAAELSIPATDEGLLRGDGVFEVMRVYRGTPFALDEHLDRMERSAANLRLPAVPRAELEAEIPALLAARGDDADRLLRILLTRGGRRLLLTEPAPVYEHGISAGFVTYSPPRILDGVKSLSYGGNMLATRIARERGFEEAVLVTPHGRVLEGPTMSLFWAGPDGVLCTPPLDEHILASITRGRVMRLVEVTECVCTKEDILGASEAFFASTNREVQAIGRVEDHTMELGSRTREAADAFRAHIDEELRSS
jgi:branched-chain amino acid aminotransferase